MIFTVIDLFLEDKGEAGTIITAHGKELVKLQDYHTKLSYSNLKHLFTRFRTPPPPPPHRVIEVVRGALQFSKGNTFQRA